MKDSLTGFFAALLFVGIPLLVVGGAVFLTATVTIWHSDNFHLCQELGGNYDAMDGTGQCVKDQVILFDPRHPYEER